MSQSSKEELVKRWHPRYLQAGRTDKTKILDEYIAFTGFHRKHAIRILRKGVPSCPREQRGRQRTYSGSVVSAPSQIRHVCGCICGK